MMGGERVHGLGRVQGSLSDMGTGLAGTREDGYAQSATS